ncbi:hypothetical protein PTKIN_Ptkin18bG0025100 [Pterospermum kingtungense]
MPSILRHHFSDWSSLHNYDHAYNGHIWVLWRNQFQVCHVDSSDQSITCLVTAHQKQFYFTAVYGANDGANRKNLWMHLKGFYPQLQDHAWMLAGDFNIVVDSSESSNGALGYRAEMQDFNNCRLQLSLMDHVFTGPLYTWTNNQDEGFLAKKLDRVLVNDVWNASWPSSIVEFLSPEVSDHCPALIKFEEQMDNPFKPFKFFGFWTLHPEFLEVVHASWC